MKCIVKAIGVIDHDNQAHHVEFFPGLNIITGKSSMGKSAIIEIFDFCLGNSDDTIPKGIITSRGKIFFTILEMEACLLVLCRERTSDRLFLREFYEASLKDILEGMKKKDFYRPSCYFPLRDFKKELGRFFAITLVDVDEDTGPRTYGVKKSGTPSIRSFASYMLQHQNLVANKHALFYRFDEKAKREQVIDHFKIFLGVVDQDYFWLAQNYNELKLELKKIEAQIPKRQEEKIRLQNAVEGLLIEYRIASGTDLISLTAAQIVANAQSALKKIKDANVRIDSAADTYAEQKRLLDDKRAAQTAVVRELQDKIFAVRSSIGFTETYQSTIGSIPVPEYAEVNESHCPFCDAPSEILELEANKLSHAIGWMNSELRVSSYVRESFKEEETKLNKKLDEEKENLSEIQKRIKGITSQIDQLKNKKTVDEVALRIKHRLELLIENYLDKPQTEFEGTRKTIKEKLEELRPQLDAYQVESKMRDLSYLIDSEMARIGAEFDFEAAYKPINLKFDLESFDLWHESPDMGNVYLRSMGSGANWLYTHLTLFLALHSVFALMHENGCKIPPILFLDQPTQVYFPSTIDHGKSFKPKELAATAGRENSVDHDMSAVTNMFNKFVEFCENTYQATGIRPQLIVTDHVDDLELANNVEFHDFVRATWRDTGFIGDRVTPEPSGS